MTYWEPGKESEYRTGHITNLSRTGAFIAADTPLAPPAKVHLRLILNDRTLNIAGEVTRSIGETQFVVKDSGSGMGIRFLDPTADDVRVLATHGIEER